MVGDREPAQQHLTLTDLGQQVRITNPTTASDSCAK
jgi:hypothetical protein